MKVNLHNAALLLLSLGFLCPGGTLQAQLTVFPNVIPSSCNNCSGAIYLDVSGGTPPFTYQWSNGWTASNINNLCPGTYCITVTDATGQTASTCEYISQPPLLFASACASDASCSGINDGSIFLTVTGGVAPYSYAWYGPNGFSSTVKNPDNVPAGVYTCIVTDGTGCVTSAAAVVNQPPQINLSASVTNSGPNGSTGSIDLTVSGGTAPYTYQWSNSANIQDISGISAGSYTVTVIDAKGCIKVQSATVESGSGNGGSAPIQLNATVNKSGCGPDCNGSISVSASGGIGQSYVYLWSTGNTTASINYLCPGDYCVTVYDFGNNSVSNCYSVSGGQSINLEIQSGNTAFCNYDPNGGNLPVCEKVCPHTTVTYFVDPPTNCNVPTNMQGANWSVTGAESYSLNPARTELTVVWGNPGAGLIKLWSDSAATNCYSTSRCISIVEEPEALFSTDPPAAANATLQLCKGQTVKFKNQSNHFDVLEWQFSDDLSVLSEENPQHTFLGAGTFTVMLIARSNCLCADTAIMVVEVLDTDPPLLDCVGSVCPGESVTYTTSGNCSNYVWQVSPNGTVQNGGGPSDNTITVQWNSGPEGTISLSALSCNGATCPQASVFSVPVISDNAEIAGPEIVCSGSEEVYSIEPFDGTDFVWTLSGGGNIVEGQGTNKVRVIWTGQVNPGTPHWLSVKYNNCYLGCGGQDSIPVRILSPFVIFGPAEICDNSTAAFNTQLTAFSGNVNCNWTVTAPDGSITWVSPASTASIAFTPADGPGTYRIFAVPTSNNTCSASAEWTMRVAARPPKATGITGPDQICSGTTYSYGITGGTPYSLEWKVQNGLPPLQQGNPVNVAWGNTNPRILSVTQISVDGLGCKSDTLQLAVNALPQALISGDAQNCIGTVGTYTSALFPNLDYQWSVVPANAGTIKSGQGKNTVEIFWQVPGIHSVQLVRCGSTANFAATVHPEPEPIPAYPEGVCPNDIGTATAGAVYISYAWTDESGGNISNTSTAGVIPGTYALVVTDANGCKGTAEFTVDQYPAPNVTVTTADPTGFCNNSRYVSITALTPDDGIFDYQWFKDGLPYGGNTQVLVTNQYGKYSATVTNKYGCVASDGTVKLFEYCGGDCHNPDFPVCHEDDLDFKYSPSPRCDSFDFALIDLSGAYQPGTASWKFGESGGVALGNATGVSSSFVFPNAGKYIVILYAQLTNGAVCIVVDSVDVEASAQFSQVLACPGDSTFFTDESTRLPEADIVNWQWDFGLAGNADTSTTASPGHPYAAAGNYAATLTVTTASGCTSTFTDNVFVPAPPAPAFAQPAANCVNNATAFSPSPPADFVAVKWDFGDPASANLNTSEARVAYHKFTPAGNYNVALTATNIYGCKATFSQPVTITPNPFSGNITPGGTSAICEGKSITLNAPSAVGATYAWSDGSAAATITVDEEGVYDVTLTNANGCTYSPPSKNVEVNPAPVGTIKLLEINDLGQVTGVLYPPAEVCAGEDVNLQIQSNGSYTYNWSGGNGNDDILVFSEDRGNLLLVGNYTYTVTITNATTGCTAVTSPFDLSVNPLPSGFSLSSDQVCAGSPNTISYTGPQPANWQVLWNTGAAGYNPLVTEEAGLYFVRVVNEHGCVAQSNTVVIFPGPNIAALPSGCHARCNPDTLCIPALPGIVSWQWYFDGTLIPGATGSNLVATESGTYWAELVDVNGCNAQSAALTLDLYQGSGDILGQVWADVNDNGIIDALDTLVSGIPVLLLQNNVPVAASQSVANGAFDFLNVPSTSYTVQIDSMALSPVWDILIGENQVALFGCAVKGFADLLIDLHPCTPLASTVQLSACQGMAANYAGTDIFAGQSQDFTLKNTLGCDSIVTVSVSALPVSASSLNVKTCPGSTYNFAGVDLAVGQTQAFTLTNYLGCDSIVTVLVSALPVSASTLNVKTCPGSTYNYAGVDLAVGQAQAFTLTNYLGCDSIVTVSVSALPVSASTLDVKTCPGSTYNFAGVDLAVGQSQAFTLTNYLGCDSIVTVSVSALPVSASSLDIKTCPGSTYNFAGVDLAVGQSQAFTLTNSLGCDSIVTVSVSALPVSASSLNVKTCPGSTYNYAGVDLAAGQTQAFTLTNYLGCDSIVTVSVFEKSTSVEYRNFEVCPGVAYPFNGIEIAAGTTQEFHFVNFEGCDSTIVIAVQALPELAFDVVTKNACSNSPTGSMQVNSVAGVLPVSFSLNNVDFQADTRFDALAAADYIVFALDGNGCVFEKPATVGAYPPLEVTLPETHTISCDSAVVQLLPAVSGDLNGLQFKWSDGSSAPSAEATNAGPAWVEVTNHCQTIHRETTVKWAVLDEDQDFFFVPNIFAPGAEKAENQTFRSFLAKNIELLEYRIDVYDRWGNFMFGAALPETAWDGLFRGKLLDPGVFAWQLKARIRFCGRELDIRRSGDVTLLR